MLEVASSSPVHNKQNYFQIRQPEMLAINLISSIVPMCDKAVVPYATNYTMIAATRGYLEVLMG